MSDNAALHTKWIAVDWGTSQLRAWVFGPGGAVLARLGSADGMGKMTPDGFEPALLALVAPYLPPDHPTPVICCGMVGARQGWTEAAYAAVPAPPPGIDRATIAPTQDARLDVRILPGMSQAAPADVMRGEETQIAGFLASTPGFDGVICLPGTHTKWVQISAGEIIGFRTFMTGELFAAISGHSVLRHSVGEGYDEAAFLAAAADALTSPEALSSRLFGLRAEALLQGLAPEIAASRLSGLLIGLELAGARGFWLGQRVALVGGAAHCARYAAALQAQGVIGEIADGDTMVLAGLGAAWAAHQDKKER